jgi:NAD(P)-dependent dehydrogenase (short-subunit alcohol dehydrogenase family)
MQTILITGCSSGYGLETARHFLVNGWNVIATMRTPREDILPRSERLRVLPLDVTSEASISATVKAAGPIDVLVNNAGIGVVGAFEATTMSHIRKVFETNTRPRLHERPPVRQGRVLRSRPGPGCRSADRHCTRRPPD